MTPGVPAVAAAPQRASLVKFAPPSARGGCPDLAAWSDARLAAQTIVVPVQMDQIASIGPLVQQGAGGVILFGFGAPADLGAQLSALKKLAPENLAPIVMTDEEGGGVQRMANLAGNMPWASEMGNSMTPSAIETQTASVARQMARNGVTMDLAPVADIDGRNMPPGLLNPDGWRSFSGNSVVTTQDVLAFVKGMQAGGVIPVLKHFPGLGYASGDTDEMTAHTLPWNVLQQSALLPFAESISAGAPAVMISTALIPGLSSVPAALSASVVTGVLRGELKFHGLIITDTLSSAAIANSGYSVPAAAVQSLGAGSDMVMYTGDGAMFNNVVQAIVSALATGRLSRSRLIAAASSVLALKNARGCG